MKINSDFIREVYCEYTRLFANNSDKGMTIICKNRHESLECLAFFESRSYHKNKFFIGDTYDFADRFNKDMHSLCQEKLPYVGILQDGEMRNMIRQARKDSAYAYPEIPHKITVDEFLILCDKRLSYEFDPPPELSEVFKRVRKHYKYLLYSKSLTDKDGLVGLANAYAIKHPEQQALLMRCYGRLWLSDRTDKTDQLRLLSMLHQN